MDEKDEKILEALSLLIEAKKGTSDETLKNATKEELVKYIDLLEEIKAQINLLIDK